MALYNFAGRAGLSPGELFFWVTVDTTMDHFGIHDAVAVAAIISGQPLIPTRGKLGGATRGTSLASSVLSNRLNVRLPFRLPTLTGASLRTLRIMFTNNLGRFIGRTIPVVGWFLVAADVSQILYRSVVRYNGIALREDRWW